MGLLDLPFGYLLYQRLVGGIKARRRCMRDHVTVMGGMRVLDVGCGPGYVSAWLPGSDYVGIDIDEKYIEYAQARYGAYGRFYCTLLTEEFLREQQPFDYVLMNGVLHHLDDYQAQEVIRFCRQSLTVNGYLVTMDGYYKQQQHPVSRFLLKHDRGKFVRSKSRYIELAQSAFSAVRPFEHADYFYVPYDSLVMECQRSA